MSPEMIEAAEAASLALPAMPGRALPNDALPSRAMPCFAVPSRDPSVYHKKLARVLDRMGALYTVNDLLTAIGEGRMQSFVVDNSWAVTQLNVYPRARTLQIIAMVGDLADIDQLHAKLLAFAGEANCGLMSAYGRMGWMPDAMRLGWRVKAKNYLYHREM